ADGEGLARLESIAAARMAVANDELAEPWSGQPVDGEGVSSAREKRQTADVGARQPDLGRVRRVAPPSDRVLPQCSFGGAVRNGSRMISMRRFFCLPSALPFDATGSNSA